MTILRVKEVPAMEEKPKTEPIIPVEPVDPDVHPEWEPRRLCPDQKIDHTVPDEPTEP